MRDKIEYFFEVGRDGNGDATVKNWQKEFESIHTKNQELKERVAQMSEALEKISSPHRPECGEYGQKNGRCEGCVFNAKNQFFGNVENVFDS